MVLHTVHSPSEFFLTKEELEMGGTCMSRCPGQVRGDIRGSVSGLVQLGSPTGVGPQVQMGH